MDAFRKHASKLREQVVKQQQAVVRQFSLSHHGSSDVIITDEAELQRHQQLDKLYASTRITKHFQRDITKGLENAALHGARQVEVVNKLCEDMCNYASENLGMHGLLGNSLYYYGTHRAALERDKEILFNSVNNQVVEPLKAMVNGAALEDARHLVQQYDRMRQEAETQAAELAKRQARQKEAGGGADTALKVQIAEGKLQSITSSMAVLGKEATTAMQTVDAQQQRLTLQRLIALVENERLYHRRAAEVLDQIQAQIVSERQKHDSLPPTRLGNISVTHIQGPGRMEEQILDSFEGLVIDGANRGSTMFLAQVMHAFDGEAEGELFLSVGDIVAVRQVSQSGWSEGECKGKAGWFPSAFVQPLEQIPGTKLVEIF